MSEPVCANCGHSKRLHFKYDAYVPGKCDFQYDLCSCRNYEPAPETPIDRMLARRQSA